MGEMSIFKYQVQITDYFAIDMPLGAKILTVQTQNGHPFIWALVNPEKPDEERRYFRVYGTGRPFYGGKYIGTFQTPPFVWHLFEEVKPFKHKVR